MLTLLLSVVLAVLQSAALGTAAPLASDSLPLDARGTQYCANSPSTVAGATTPALTPRSLLTNTFHPVHARSTTTLWCASQSSTYITVTMTSSTSQTGLGLALTLAYLSIGLNHLVPPAADTLVPGSGFSYTEDWVITAQNANNHQTTWGVLAAALGALSDYVTSQDLNGAATFGIFDGANQVGQGTVAVGSGPAPELIE
ncbi:hypothetical protein MMC08_006264 [Hypocenomyce scalaris]|nr:hypothetical protein [Hypocenomyce scalaris]